MSSAKKVFVGGTFDGLHVGHQFFLWNAVSLASEMVVVVARDETVLRYKKQMPRFLENERLSRVCAENLPHTQVRLGRRDGDFFQTLREESPDILLLGYDQRLDPAAVQKQFPTLRIERADPFAPEFFKSARFRYTSF